MGNKQNKIDWSNLRLTDPEGWCALVDGIAKSLEITETQTQQEANIHFINQTKVPTVSFGFGSLDKIRKEIKGGSEYLGPDQEINNL